MPNPVYTYIFNIYDMQMNSLLVPIFKLTKAHLFAQLNGFEYYYLTLIVLFAQS